jgi:hypothetical protein
MDLGIDRQAFPSENGNVPIKRAKVDAFAKSYIFGRFPTSRKIEGISKIGSAFRARLATAKKRSIHWVCEHFLPLRNEGLGA